MAEVTLSIAGRNYDITCRDGDEAHLLILADLVDQKARTARQGTPGLTEVRQLLFAALFLADELSELRRTAAGAQGKPGLAENSDEQAEKAMEMLAARLETLAERLAAAPATS